jgi:hypothetical protein
MTKIIHPVAGAITLLTIATFWLSTVLSELFGSEALIVSVKTAIPWGFLLLIPALIAAGGSGFVLSKGVRAGVIGAKLKRMPSLPPMASWFSFLRRCSLLRRRVQAFSIQTSMPFRLSNSLQARPTSHFSASTCVTACD